ncbi:hypothetical protein RHMOL_Rhmol05G0260300 [Rhododendron molle]|uniref:Uncharacterized protein n=1 Tax=Rhododendron molle TaxID=49168 RepID=A0ACC0NTD5_RHOML|nr:hypothetical protein RHMOL_Rhmol05G0260300 [Rhododendron molle]
MNDVSNRASSDHTGKKFATAKANYASLNSVYGLAQCMPYMSDSECAACLWSSISVFLYSSEARQGANIILHQCYVRYETYLFYNASFGAAPPPPSLVQAPSANRTHVAGDSGNGGVSSQVITAIVVPIGIVILLFIASFCFLTRRAKKKNNCNKENNVGDDISIVQSLQYDLSTIQAATNNFSDDKKLGEGGFGPVYKGLLPDGQEVAVKRLSRTSPQGAQEFKTEVGLVAKLHHRNLIKIRGFCLEGEEKILIYEFAPNKSLDYILFGLTF